MSANAQMIGFVLAIVLPSLTSVIGTVVFGREISELRGHLGELRAHMDERFDRLEQRITDRLRAFGENMDARLGRIEDRLRPE